MVSISIDYINVHHNTERKSGQVSLLRSSRSKRKNISFYSASLIRADRVSGLGKRLKFSCKKYTYETESLQFMYPQQLHEIAYYSVEMLLAIRLKCKFRYLMRISYMKCVIPNNDLERLYPVRGMMEIITVQIQHSFGR